MRRLAPSPSFSYAFGQPYHRPGHTSTMATPDIPGRGAAMEVVVAEFTRFRGWWPQLPSFFCLLTNDFYVTSKASAYNISFIIIIQGSLAAELLHSGAGCTIFFTSQ